MNLLRRQRLHATCYRLGFLYRWPPVCSHWVWEMWILFAIKDWKKFVLLLSSVVFFWVCVCVWMRVKRKWNGCESFFFLHIFEAVTRNWDPHGIIGYARLLLLPPSSLLHLIFCRIFSWALLKRSVRHFHFDFNKTLTSTHDGTRSIQ